jgi:hypothetical protein
MRPPQPAAIVAVGMGMLMRQSPLRPVRKLIPRRTIIRPRLTNLTGNRTRGPRGPEDLLRFSDSIGRAQTQGDGCGC